MDQLVIPLKFSLSFPFVICVAVTYIKDNGPKRFYCLKKMASPEDEHETWNSRSGFA